MKKKGNKVTIKKSRSIWDKQATDPTGFLLYIRKLLVRKTPVDYLLIIIEDDLDITEAVDIAFAVKKCKDAGIYVIGHTNKLNFPNFISISLCQTRSSPPLSGPLKIEANFSSLCIYNLLQKMGLDVKVLKSSSKKPELIYFDENEDIDYIVNNQELVSKYIVKEALRVSQVSPILYSRESFPTAIDACESGLITHTVYPESLSNIFPNEDICWNNLVQTDTKFKKLIKGNSYKSNIAVVSVDMNILDLFLKNNLIATLIQIEKSKKIGAVIFIISYKGGSLSFADRMWCLVEKIKKRKPIVSYIRSAVSSGYLFASAGSQIYMNQCGYLGAIGTYIVRVNHNNLLSNLGIERVNPFERNPNPVLNSDNKEKEEIERMSEIGLSVLKNRIKKSRGLKNDLVFDGTLFNAADAKKHSLIDDNVFLLDILLDPLKYFQKGNIKIRNKATFQRFEKQMKTKPFDHLLNLYNLIRSI